MKYKALATVVLAAFLTACDDTTNEIGTSLLHDMDSFTVSTDSFNVESRSIVADSVYARTTTGYLGKVRDPETGSYITGHFMTQFHVQEDYANTFPKADSIASRIDGQIVADSCELRVYYDSFFGDSLATMKLRVHEMAKPMFENQLYYSSFNPITEGYIREDGIHQDKVYTMADLSVSESERSSSSYTRNIQVKLNDPYTDKEGNTYNNFGSYLMNAYYKNPTAFGNSLKFMKEILPGFYLQHTGGIGAMAYVSLTQLNIYFRFIDADTISSGIVSFAGTEEILQTTTVENDKNTIRQLAADNTCTYLKTPAGIFTELTLPVDDILRGHDTDSINSAKIVLSRINDKTQGDYNLDAPATLLMIPKAIRSAHRKRFTGCL